MSFTEAVQSGFSKYADFSGRSSRSAYWWWALFAFLCLVAGQLISLALDTTIVYIIVALALFLPGLAVSVRRLHDLGRSGWWYLIAFVPLIGAIVLLVWFCTAGEDAPNQYGASADGAPGFAAPVI